MERRKFIHMAALGAAGMTLPSFSFNGLDMRMGIVVHSYAFRWNSTTPSQKFPGFPTAIELLEHCADIGAGGIQVMVNGWTTDFAKKVRDRREALGLYLEGSVSIPMKADEVAAFETTVINAKEAGANILRTVTSTGRRYEAYHSMNEVNDFKKKAVESIKRIEPILKKHKVKLAVENHKDWTAPELAGVMKGLSSEWIGVTLDFGNSIALLEEPMSVIETLSPFVVSTHVKDMGVEEYKDGFLLSEVPLGRGFLDLQKMFSLCLQHNPSVRFSLEMITRDPLQIPCLTDDYWKVFGDGKARDLAKSLRMIKANEVKELPRVSQLDAEAKLAVEEQNILSCLDYSKTKLEK